MRKLSVSKFVRINFPCRLNFVSTKNPDLYLPSVSNSSRAHSCRDGSAGRPSTQQDPYAEIVRRGLAGEKGTPPHLEGGSGWRPYVETVRRPPLPPAVPVISQGVLVSRASSLEDSLLEGPPGNLRRVRSPNAPGGTYIASYILTHLQLRSTATVKNAWLTDEDSEADTLCVTMEKNAFENNGGCWGDRMTKR